MPTAMTPSASLPLPPTSPFSSSPIARPERQTQNTSQSITQIQLAGKYNSPIPTVLDYSAVRHKTSLSEHSSPLPFFAKRGQYAPSTIHHSPSSYTGAKPLHARAASATSSLSDRVDIPDRTTSLRRKPVPGMVTLPNNTVPSSHPFASAASTTSIPASMASTPYSPGIRADEELFFAPPRSGPLPPRRPKSERSMERSSSSTGSAHDMPIREEMLRAREEALLAREEALREREEFVKRAEALRQREDELRMREDALSARESAATPVPSTPASQVIHSGNTALGAPVTFPVQDRPLPAVPDLSQVHLRQSSESMPSPITPDSNDSNLDGPNFRFPASPKALSEKQSTIKGVPKTRSSTKTKRVFSVDAKPTSEDLIQASTLFVRDEDGQLVSFGDFLPHPYSPVPNSMPGDNPVGTENEVLPPITKTVVFFIRSFWCGQCQDYTIASLSLLDPVAVRKAGVRVVVISNGNYKVIKAYRRILKLPFPLYVDGPRKLYSLLGMKSSQSFGPLFNGRPAYHQRSVPAQIVHGVGNAFFKFPLAGPGSLSQLGGEFIFSSNNTCEFAHRMTTRSNHMEAPEVVRLAGVASPVSTEIKEVELGEAQKAELDKMASDMEQWRLERELEIERVRQRKLERKARGVTSVSSQPDSRLEFDESLEDEIEYDDDIRQEYGANEKRQHESVSMSVTSDFSLDFEDALRMDREEMLRRRVEPVESRDLRVEVEAK